MTRKEAIIAAKRTLLASATDHEITLATMVLMGSDVKTTHHGKVIEKYVRA